MPIINGSGGTKNWLRLRLKYAERASRPLPREFFLNDIPQYLHYFVESRPNTPTPLVVGTYTLPLAIIGGAYLFAVPKLSRPPEACVVL